MTALPADLAALLSRLLPDAAVRTVRELGRGGEHVAYLVDEHLVVRRSRDADPGRRAQATQRDASLLQVIADVSPLPTPRPLAVDAEAGVLVYRRIAGVSLLDRPSAQTPRIEPPLAAFLTAVHGIATSRVAALVTADRTPPAAHRDEATTHLRVVADQLAAGDERLVADFLERPPPPPADLLVFGHNDLGAEHLLVDPSSGTLTGVIDWSDAGRTDPAYDVGLLLRDLGPDSVLRILAGYEHPWQRSDLERAAFYACCALLEDLAWGLRTGDARYIRAATLNLRRTFTFAAGV